jgi:acetyl-CoA carboxylase carboxyl transferase subunit alpha
VKVPAAAPWESEFATGFIIGKYLVLGHYAEGCASILYRESTKAPLAAEAMKVTARDLDELKIADEIIPEPLGGAHRDPDTMALTLKTVLLKYLGELSKIPTSELVEQRVKKYAGMGTWKSAADQS